MKDQLLPEDVIWKQSSEGSYDLITSGAIPPNPAELLMQDRVASLFEYLKENYDYIIVDTAPVSLVTDTILIGHHADLTLYLVRADYTDSRILEYPSKLYNEKRLPNMAILLNAVDQSKGYYGKYGYEYSYGNKKKKNFLNPFS
jgi:Mrp family chromosome partitioning ATPase